MSSATILGVGFVVDLVLGEPAWLPHPVVVIGKAIVFLEKTLRRVFPRTPRGEIAAGAVLVALVCLAAFFSAFLLLHLLARLDLRLAFAAECYLGYQLLATRCLADAAKKVFKPLAGGDLASARRAVAIIVGRDTAPPAGAGVPRAPL